MNAEGIIEHSFFVSLYLMETDSIKSWSPNLPAVQSSLASFYALNVQAICSKTKSFLWLLSGHKSSMHNRLAFCETDLFETLNTVQAKLTAEGLFLVGAEYPLMGYLLTPYEGIKLLSEENSFNFWLSNSQI